MKRSVTVVVVIGVVVFVFCGAVNHVVQAADSVPRPQIDSHAEQEATIALEAKFKIPKTDNESDKMTMRIENSISGISATVSALAANGRALMSSHRYDEAYEVYTQLLASVKLDTTRPSLTREINAGRSYALLKHAQNQINEAVRTRKIAPEILEKIRADLEIVIQLGVGHGYIARANLLFSEVEVISGRPREGLILAEKFLAEYYANAEVVKQRPLQIMQMHLCVARAARSSGDYAKVLQTCDRVKAIYDQLSRKQQDRHNLAETMVAASFELFMTLIQTKADPGDINAAGQEVILRLPESQYATIAKMYLRPPASMPSP